MWTLLRTSHRFTPKAKSFIDQEKAVNEFQSNVFMNANQQSQKYIPPPYIQPQNVQDQRMCCHAHREYCHQNLYNQHSNFQFHTPDENQQVNDQHCCS
ncbi:hypothetical protein OJ253_579 [Cryptosporidium canis]|uniref:Uncharacterized protein n=1 Tax=Cryptosporidium canis TaxID=195482 RepID=A0A9D5HYT1_9CRYT|nr:hypothetical protein OJ253_579 [Cryptosporidium canis]